MKAVATIYTDFSEKFGIPRQGALAHESEGIIVFEPEYRMEEALRGPDTSKTAASWFGACIFLIVAATILRSFFL